MLNDILSLNNILSKIDVSKDEKWWDVGIILFNPKNNIFYHISFGDGSNSDFIREGCDDYMYLDTRIFTDNGEYLMSVDGQMDFNRNDSGYTGYINDVTLIADCLDFMNCPSADFDDLVFIRKISN